MGIKTNFGPYILRINPTKKLLKIQQMVIFKNDCFFVFILCTFEKIYCVIFVKMNSIKSP